MERTTEETVAGTAEEIEERVMVRVTEDQVTDADEEHHGGITAGER